MENLFKMKKCRTCKIEKKDTEFYLAHSYSKCLRPDCIKCGLKISKKNNWRNQTKGFPYKGIDDPKYIEDRDSLFKSNGNGWWWYQGFHFWKESLNKIKKQKENDQVEV